MGIERGRSIERGGISAAAPRIEALLLPAGDEEDLETPAFLEGIFGPENSAKLVVNRRTLAMELHFQKDASLILDKEGR
ncbi:hypothetical protein ACLOJK_018370, partial [Asimina triloba]